MKKTIKTSFALAFALVLLMSLFVFPASAASGEQAPLIRIGLGADESTLNPHTYRFENGYNLTHLIWDSLMVLDENLAPMPWLAEEVTVSNDGLVYSFKIHEGVTFHDGMPLTSADVQFTYLQTRDNPSAKSRFKAPLRILSDVRIIDELTVEMILTAPNADFLNKPCSEIGILPKHIWEKIELWDATDERIGSGAYKLVDMASDGFYMLEANPNYWNGRAVAQAIYLPVIADRTALFTALRAGEIDASMIELSPELISEFRSLPNLSTVAGGGFTSTLVYFNCERYPFDLTDFRLALTSATNVQEIIDVIMLGNATYGSLGYIHPNLPVYSPNVNKVGFDLSKANQMLDNLGFTNRNSAGVRLTDRGEPLQFEMLVYSTNAVRIRIAEFLKGWWEEIGVGITIMAMDPETVDDLVWPGFDASNGREFDVVMFGWGASTMNSAQRTLENMHSDLSKGNSNIGAYANAELDVLLDALLAETNPQRRNQLNMQIQDVYSRDPGAITLYYADLVFGYNPAVFDNWTYRLGAGIINNLSLIDRSYVPEAPAPGESASPSPSQAPSQAPGGTAPGGTAPSPSASASASPGAPAPGTVSEPGGGGFPTWAIILIIVVVLVGGVLVFVFARKSRLK